MSINENWFHLLHPKVIHLVTTLDSRGRINAAPFTWITPISDDPPIILMAAWYESDTFKNIEETGEFVLNVVPKELKQKILICAKKPPRGVNELEKAGLTWSKSKIVKPPRVNECIAWVECSAKEVVKKEDEYSFIVAEVKCVDVKKNCFNKNFLPKVDILLHLGGGNYSSIRV